MQPNPSPRELLVNSFHNAIAAVKADRVLPGHLPLPGRGRTLVVGAGKAAADMAACVENHWSKDAPLAGLVITRHGHGAPTDRIEVLEAGHPLPDAAGSIAAQRLLSAVGSATPEDMVLALVSGGGSSLLSLSAEGLELADIRAVGQALLNSGAPIADINCVRKHLSRTLGGRLAAACRAPVRVLTISDVAGDDPSVIASGPFAPDPTTFADALAVLTRWGIHEPKPVLDYLRDGRAGLHPETPKPGTSDFSHIEHRLVANGRDALIGAAAYFRSRGVTPVILGDSVTGEARESAQVFAALVREIRLHASPWLPPVVLLSGGETSVTVRGKGRGGRNMEFLLALALALQNLENVHALAADTDGIDGTTDGAGACIGPDTLASAANLGLSPRDCLDDNDAYRFFSGLDALIKTGPTRTNANDYRAILIT